MTALLVTRRNAMRAATGAALALPYAARAAGGLNGSYTIRFGTLWPVSRWDNMVMEGFAARVKQLTDGHVTVQLFPNSQLGDERSMTESVKTGALQMTSGGGPIQGFVPEVGLFYLGYLYRSYEQFVHVWSLGKSSVADNIAAHVQQRAGIKVLGYVCGGARDTVLRNHPIKTLADFKGLKIRADQAPTSTGVLMALGASPTPVAYAEVYQALQTGVVEAAENPPSGLIGQKWYEVTKFLSLTDHQYVLHLLQMNLAFWESLPEKYQRAVQQAADATVEDYNNHARENRSAEIKELAGKGLVVNQIPDKTAFIDAAKPFNQRFIQKYHLEKEYDAILATPA